MYNYPFGDKIKEVKVKFIINQDNIPASGEMYLIFDVLNGNGKIVQTVTKKIDHDSEVLEYFTPRKIPDMSVIKTEKKGYCVSVFKKNIVSEGVKLYAKVLESTKPRDESSGYQEIGDFKFGQNRFISEVFDFSTDDPVIIRGIPYSSKGTISLKGIHGSS